MHVAPGFVQSAFSAHKVSESQSMSCAHDTPTFAAGAEHVPPHTGHGCTSVSPRYTTEARCASTLPAPVSTFAVPEMLSAKRFTTHAGVLPEESGNGAPK